MLTREHCILSEGARNAMQKQTSIALAALLMMQQKMQFIHIVCRLTTTVEIAGTPISQSWSKESKPTPSKNFH